LDTPCWIPNHNQAGQEQRYRLGSLANQVKSKKEIVTALEQQKSTISLALKWSMPMGGCGAMEYNP
jgi:hypothetical protein